MATEDRQPAASRKGGALTRLVRIAHVWSLLIAATTLVRVLGVVGDFLPDIVFADGLFDPGNVATVGGALAIAAFLVSLFVWRSGLAWRRLALVGLIAIHAITIVAFPPNWLIRRLETPEVLFFVETDLPAFALTIDDGFDPATTPLLLEVLAQHNARATFFVLGETLAKYPQLAQSCLDAGHELANHQMTDTPAVMLSEEDLTRSIQQAHERLAELHRPKWFRPGGGIPMEVAVGLARQLGYRVVLGSVFPYDSHVSSHPFISAYVNARTDAGDIVILHDRGERGRRTIDVLNEVLPALAKRGLRAVTLGELAAKPLEQ